MRTPSPSSKPLVPERYRWFHTDAVDPNIYNNRSGKWLVIVGCYYATVLLTRAAGTTLVVLAIQNMDDTSVLIDVVIIRSTQDAITPTPTATIYNDPFTRRILVPPNYRIVTQLLVILSIVECDTLQDALLIL